MKLKINCDLITSEVQDVKCNDECILTRDKYNRGAHDVIAFLRRYDIKEREKGEERERNVLFRRLRIWK